MTDDSYVTGVMTLCYDTGRQLIKYYINTTNATSVSPPVGAPLLHAARLDVQRSTECADCTLGPSRAFNVLEATVSLFPVFSFPPLFLTFQSTKVTGLYAAIWAAVGNMWSAPLEASSAASRRRHCWGCRPVCKNHVSTAVPRRARLHPGLVSSSAPPL